MNKLEVKLRQHTPLIHFQHSQDGATLRASEVKPKLDKYILTKLSPDEKEKGKKDGWIKIKNEKVWLDYKMRIKAENVIFWNMEQITDKTNAQGNPIVNKMPLYFGDMNNSIPKKLSYCKGPISLTIFSMKKGVIDEINKYKDTFFFFHNFGTRQSKGFGSFSTEKECISAMNYPFTLAINTKSADEWSRFYSLFRQINYFYKILRSGINENGQYFKSMMYYYAKEKKQYWDKRAIRTHFQLFAKGEEKKEIFNVKYKYQDKGENSDFSNDKYKGTKSADAYLYRDVLGLSKTQEWKFYGATINKLNSKVERFKSPILIKPLSIDDKGNYKVFVIPYSIPSQYLGQEMEMSVEYKEKNNKVEKWKKEKRLQRNKEPMSLSLPKDFDVADYLKYVFDPEGGGKIVEKQINNMADGSIKKMLKRIYNVQ